MIISLERAIEVNDLQNLVTLLSTVGCSATEVVTQSGRYVIAVGSREFDIRRIGILKGVRDVHYISESYQLVSREWKVGYSAIPLSEDFSIGNGNFSIIAGPCSIEDRPQVEGMCDFLESNRIHLMRGGAFKPRSSPYSFRGLGLEGLKMFSEVTRGRGIKVVTEVLDASHIESMLEYVDVFQVGARNSQNFTLLDGLGEVDKPVLLKRGMSGTVEELLQSAEYIYSKGNEKIILCERGIRTFEKAYRNTLDLNAVPYLKEKSHLPVVVDPSHGVGIRAFVPTMALAGVMSGADGCLVEVHQTPEKALSDGAQTLNFQEAEVLFSQIRRTVELRDSFAVGGTDGTERAR
jgi:3-deoxy-7-phosphoheptulonate synthase